MLTKSFDVCYIMQRQNKIYSLLWLFIYSNNSGLKTRIKTLFDVIFAILLFKVTVCASSNGLA